MIYLVNYIELVTMVHTGPVELDVAFIDALGTAGRILAAAVQLFILH